MLAQEPFSDRPAGVCPALREFLQAYNDRLGDGLRQDLYGLASAVVGTRGAAATTGWRARLCVDWARSLVQLERAREPTERPPIPFRNQPLHDCGVAGAQCARLAELDPWFHRQTLAFVSWLCRARLQPAPLLGPPHGLDPVPGVELLHDRGQVVADGARREVERPRQLGDRGVLPAGRQHLVLTRGER